MWKIIDGSGREKTKTNSHNSLKQDIGSDRDETKVFKLGSVNSTSLPSKLC